MNPAENFFDLKRKENNEEADEEVDEILAGKPESVSSLSADNFEEFLNSTPEAFVMFYAPCKKL